MGGRKSNCDPLIYHVEEERKEVHMCSSRLFQVEVSLLNDDVVVIVKVPRHKRSFLNKRGE